MITLNKNDILNDFESTVNQLVDWIEYNNIDNNFPVEATVITDDGYPFFNVSCITFGWKERHPDLKNKSIWYWWSYAADRIVVKIKFNSVEESCSTDKVRAIIEDAVLKLQHYLKKERMCNKLKELKKDFI